MKSDAMPNSLLAVLPPKLVGELMASGETVPLELKRILHEPDEPASHVYFPLSGVVSLLTVLDDGSAVEIATVGREGMTDFAAYLDLESPARWLVQVPGSAVRVEAAELRRQAESVVSSQLSVPRAPVRSTHRR